MFRSMGFARPVRPRRGASRPLLPIALIALVVPVLAVPDPPARATSAPGGGTASGTAASGTATVHGTASDGATWAGADWADAASRDRSGPAGSLAPPTDVRVPPLAYDDTSITLVWNKPRNHAAIVDYRVYSGGALLGSAGQDSTSPAKPYIDRFYADPANGGQVRVVMNTFTATGLRPNTRYTFTVRSVDASGHESPDSARVTQATTRVPPVFNVVDYGAVGDGSTLNTAAIQAAIDACAPGGKVLIPPGVFKTGALWLHSDMTFEVAAGATLLGSENAADYPYNYLLYDYSNDIRFYSLINAHTYDYGTISNIRIVGAGIIDGNGWRQNGVNADGFPVAMPSNSSTVSQNGILAKAQVERAAQLGSGTPYVTRSNLITLRGVNNVYYGGFTARNPANHTLVNLHSNNVTVNGVRLETYDINNADGVEFANGSGLMVINNVFDTGDDCVNFAAGLGAASERDVPTRNAWISNNYFREGHGAVVAGSHTGAWISDVVAEDNVMHHTDVGLRMKTDPNNGGGARRFLFRDNAMRDITNQAFIFTSAYSDRNAAIVVEPAPEPARFRDVVVSDVTVDGTGRESISVIGVPDAYHRDLHFTNVSFRNVKPANIAYLKDGTFAGVTFEGTADPWIVTHSSGLSFTGDSTATGVTVDAAAAPAWPAGARLSAAAGAVSVTLSWPAATDNVAVAGYTIYQGDRPVATVPGDVLSYRLEGLSPDLPYRLRVAAFDATGGATATRLEVRVTTAGDRDTTAPSVPTGPDAVTAPAAGVGTTWARLSWRAATDDHGVAGYRLYANGVRAGWAWGDGTAFTFTGLRAGTPYRLSVVAVDAAGNATGYGQPAQITTGPRYDTGAPWWPAGGTVRATAVDATSATLTWSRARDDTAVVGYRLYRDGAPIPAGASFTPVNDARTATATTFRVTGLSPGTRYVFTVRAGDAVNKWTGSGPSLSIRTSF